MRIYSRRKSKECLREAEVCLHNFKVFSRMKRLEEALINHMLCCNRHLGEERKEMMFSKEGTMASRGGIIQD